ncbi:MAG: hypothetical protein R2829_07470 [Bacteroidia bacterium]
MNNFRHSLHDLLQKNKEGGVETGMYTSLTYAFIAKAWSTAV